MAQHRTYLTLSQAAKQTGKSKSVLSKALKNGKLSYASKDSSGYKIDAAELFRVFPQQEQKNNQEPRSRTTENTHENGLENTLKIKELEVENKLLHERLKDKEERIDELQEERNEWRSQAQKLLITYQPSQNDTEMADKTKNDGEAGKTRQEQEKPLRAQLWAVVTVILLLAGAVVVGLSKSNMLKW